ncbi:MAG: winged helix-turn-helix domain-containing protein [Acidobacteriota bacterium]
MFRFNNHTFDPETGELDGPRESLRLQPKPARLLTMLLEAAGELVERGAIRDALWPDTTVDFDAGLHTCMGQIRTAIKETGGDAELIETLPKRGYRIIVPVAPDGPHHQPGADEPLEETRLTDASTMPYVITFLLLLAATGFALWNELATPTVDRAATPPGRSTPPATAPAPERAAPARLAVLPLVDPEADEPGTFNRELTAALVAALVDAAPGELVVVGPATTAQYAVDGAAIAEIAAAVDADFVLSGGRAGSGTLFLQVVTPDGGHVFARRYDETPGTPAQIAAELAPPMSAAIVAARGS